MKVILATTPIRPIPTDFPPIGSLSILSYLQRQGIGDIEFFNIDANRPRFDEAVAHIVEAAPDILGISSVVSTAYDYTKRLSLAIKEALPETLIVVGGNLAASAEILLHRTGTDICVLGEGEWVFHEIIKRAKSTNLPIDFADIPGLMFLNETGKPINTGTPPPLDKTEIYDINWDILLQSSDITQFVTDVRLDARTEARYSRDPRPLEPHRKGKCSINIPSAKGCVARCTFCHRWEKGIRYIPVDLYIERLKHLRDRFNIGFVGAADENFGTDRKWLKEFCEKIKPLDILWVVGGMRVNCVSPEQIQMMKDAGCISINYGMETGSPRMLQIMEKKTTLEDNRNAMRWTIEAGLATVVQLVIGMPGETSETIRETIEFCKYAMTLHPDQNPNDNSINYAQALPGTDLYEYGRHKGLIGTDLDGEEEYLLSISDRDAHDEFVTLNFTERPVLEHQTWRPWITIETNYAYVQKYGIEHYRQVLLNDTKFFAEKRADSGYFANPKRIVESSASSDSIHETRIRYHVEAGTMEVPSLWSLIRTRHFGLAMICYPVLFHRLRMLLPLMVVAKNLSRAPLAYNLKILWQYVALKVGLANSLHQFKHEYSSLRKIVGQELGAIANDTPEMAPLRRGR